MRLPVVGAAKPKPRPMGSVPTGQKTSSNACPSAGAIVVRHSKTSSPPLLVPSPGVSNSNATLSSAIGVDVGGTVGVAVGAGVNVWVGVGGTGVSVGSGVRVFVNVSVGRGVTVDVGRDVEVGRGVDVGRFVAVDVGAGVDVLVAVLVAVSGTRVIVDVGFGVFVGVNVGFDVGRGVEVNFGVLVALLVVAVGGTGVLVLVAVRVGSGVNVLVGAGVSVFVAVGGTGVLVTVEVGFGVDVFVGKGVIVAVGVFDLVAVGGIAVSVGIRISADSTAFAMVSLVSAELFPPAFFFESALLNKAAPAASPAFESASDSEFGMLVERGVFVNVGDEVGKGLGDDVAVCVKLTMLVTFSVSVTSSEPDKVSVMAFDVDRAVFSSLSTLIATRVPSPSFRLDASAPA